MTHRLDKAIESAERTRKDLLDEYAGSHFHGNGRLMVLSQNCLDHLETGIALLKHMRDLLPEDTV